MLIVSISLIFLIVLSHQLTTYIKKIRTGDPNESEDTYWMFSYDFKSKNKDEWLPEDKELIKRKRRRNALVFMLYLNFFIIFLLFNNFLTHILDLIIYEEFSYPI